jgi:hypothetical protein
MANEGFERAPSPEFSEHEARNQKFQDAAGDALSGAYDRARDAAEEAKRAAADAAPPCPTTSWGFLTIRLALAHNQPTVLPVR